MALELAHRFHAKIWLFYVLEDLPLPIVSYEHLPSIAPEEYYSDSEKHTRERLEKLLSDEIPQDRRGGILVRRGIPHLEIVHAARDEGFDFIVVCTHGRTGLSHALLGSVAEKIVRQAPCPVLTVRAAVDS